MPLAEKVLELYHARGWVENTIRNIKHGIDWRLAICTRGTVVKGRILISFLVFFCMSVVRFPYPEYRNAAAESLCE